ncbi:Cof-type HAD-IIB family hydrolase [Tellurirhabdus bombi]|uniref:Cof-type HAD-IIB family hydrolase n=1 Tax=Tellurirhabdus bombi TaxID=2907205 RepID=UPI001F2E68DB|nr:Cof-type HAD-IIB family hydrolase [Tellurirhabdus bombi]
MEKIVPDIKLIATDMDGTLLNTKGELGPTFFTVFSQLKNQGILFAAASGRQFFNLQKRFDLIKDEMIFIAENGSYVVYKETELLVQDLPADTVKELIQIARTIPNTFPIICGKKRAYIETSDPELVNRLRLYFERFEIVNDLLDVKDDQFLKVTVCDLSGSEKNSYPYFQHLSDALQVKVSGPIWLDMSHKLADKGRALNVVQAHFGVTFDQTMVFGDYLNDLEMMQQAHHSYAMANAHPDVKKVAQFTAKSNDENGVLEVISEFLDQTADLTA